MHFPSNYHSFSFFSRLSTLEENLALYEERSSQILRRHFRKTSVKTTLTYYCQDKKRLHCEFSLVYKILEDESGVEWAQIQAEKTNPVHSHCSNKKQAEIDFESMRRCFKVLEPQVARILMANPLSVPVDIMEDLILGSHLTHAMRNLKMKYPKRFKKCLDNQTNKIKRKIKKMRLDGSESTIKKSKSFSSFSSEQTERTLNLFNDEDFLGKEEDDDRVDDYEVVASKEEEKREEPFNPMIFY